MKILGILAEYNPFHAGHAYQLKEARKRSGADFCVVAMSGDYVQRGEPAITSYRERAAEALRYGADLVVELPVQCVLNSAEKYAYAGMKLLTDCGCNVISFGVESSEAFPDLEKIAGVLQDEPSEYKEELKAGLKSGLSFPSALETALSKYANAYVMRSPNHILAVEYIKALRRIYADHPSDMPEILPIQRISTASASELRRTITNGITKDDYSLLLHEKLIGYSSDGSALGDRIESNKNSYISFSEFCDRLKTKSRTYTAISRKLMRIALDLSGNTQPASYIRVLGFRSSSASLLAELKTNSPLPVLINLPGDLALLSDRTGYDEAFRSTLLYRCVRTQKSGIAFPHPYSEPVLKI